MRVGSVAAMLSREVLDACRDVQSGQRHRYLLMRLSDEHRIEVDRSGIGNDHGQLLQELPETRCRWVLYDFTDTPRGGLALITWLPAQATIKERLLYTAATRVLRAELPGIDLTIDVEDRTELSYAALFTPTT
ncbi:MULTISPECIES: hypothetical protein [Nocardia]|uniref:hypothetical protein n=1 Tax=Nocardia TaxID=1817 RepID=UPI0013004EAA|nr:MULTISPECIES: hypothetical protein [Nocardia]